MVVSSKAAQQELEREKRMRLEFIGTDLYPTACADITEYGFWLNSGSTCIKVVMATANCTVKHRLKKCFDHTLSSIHLPSCCGNWVGSEYIDLLYREIPFEEYVQNEFEARGVVDINRQSNTVLRDLFRQAHLDANHEVEWS
jgi:hypothetical protein